MPPENENSPPQRDGAPGRDERVARPAFLAIGVGAAASGVPRIRRGHPTEVDRTATEVADEDRQAQAAQAATDRRDR